MQWTQWNSDIWWWGHCLWCKKVKPVDAVDAVTQWTQWMQYAVDTVDVVEKWYMVVCVLCTASSASTSLTFLYQRHCPHHHIPLFHCIHCILRPLSHCIHSVMHPLVWPFWIKNNVPTTIYHYSTVYCVHSLLCPLCPLATVSTSYCVHYVNASTELTGLTFLHQRQCLHHHIPLFHGIHCILLTVYCIHWFDLFVSRTMSPPPYTTILLCPLHTASTVSTGLNFLYQRQWSPPPYNHYSTVYCIHYIHCVHCVLCPLCDCIYWIHWFDLFVSKIMCQPPYTTIPLHPLCTASTASTGLTFLHQRQCPHHIRLFHCIHCILCPLHTASTPSRHLCVILTQPDILEQFLLVPLIPLMGLFWCYTCLTVWLTSKGYCRGKFTW